MSPAHTDLSSIAYAAGIEATRRLDRNDQKQLGQFITPVPIAKAMALRACRGLDKEAVRVANKPGFRPAGERWYADTSRESIRDDLTRNQLLAQGIMQKLPG